MIPLERRALYMAEIIFTRVLFLVLSVCFVFVSSVLLYFSSTRTRCFSLMGLVVITISALENCDDLQIGLWFGRLKRNVTVRLH